MADTPEAIPHTDPKPQADAEPTSECRAAKKPTCGIIMPISAIGDCSEAHWNDVRKILSSAIEKAGFIPSLVSDTGEISVIQATIVNNVYFNDMIVCDVSLKNPNVMFELGMRLAFDKPTIIVKDNLTEYSFDTSPVEHITYRRDLRYFDMIDFCEKLTEKIKITHATSTSENNYSPFLKFFGQYIATKIDPKEASKEDIILNEIAELRRLIASQGKTIYNQILSGQTPLSYTFDSAKDIDLSALKKQIAILKNETFPKNVSTDDF